MELHPGDTKAASASSQFSLAGRGQFKSSFLEGMNRKAMRRTSDKKRESSCRCGLKIRIIS